jgi:disulfide bond formation protein DsbB
MNYDHGHPAAGIPAAGVSGLTLLGISLPDWVLIGTAVYTVLTIYVLIRDKFYKPWKEARDVAGKTPQRP